MNAPITNGDITLNYNSKISAVGLELILVYNVVVTSGVIIIR